MPPSSVTSTLPMSQIRSPSFKMVWLSSNLTLPPLRRPDISWRPIRWSCWWRRKSRSKSIRSLSRTRWSWITKRRRLRIRNSKSRTTSLNKRSSSTTRSSGRSPSFRRCPMPSRNMMTYQPHLSNRKPKGHLSQIRISLFNLRPHKAHPCLICMNTRLNSAKSRRRNGATNWMSSAKLKSRRSTLSVRKSYKVTIRTI